MSPRSIDTRRGVAWAFLGSALSAAFLVPWKVAAEHGEPRMAVLVMLTVAASLNTLTALLQPASRGSERLSWRVTWGLSVALAVLTLAGNRCSAESVARISGALLAVTQRCEVILVALLGMVFLRERVTGSFWLGTAVAGAGLLLLQRPSATSAAVDPVGVAFGLGSAACFGAMVVLSRRYIAEIRVVSLNAIRLWLSVALWFAVERTIPDVAALSNELLVGATLAGFFGPFLSRLSALQSAHHVPANTTAVASLATPAMTLVLAFVVLGNLPTRQEVLGGTTMLVGVAIPLLAMLRR